MLGLCAALLLGCGKSEEKRAELVKCGSYSTAFGMAMLMDRSGFGTEVDRETARLDPQAGMKGAAMLAAAQQLTRQMDAVRAAARQQEGVQLATQHMERRDKGERWPSSVAAPRPTLTSPKPDRSTLRRDEARPATTRRQGRRSRAEFRASSRAGPRGSADGVVSGAVKR